MAHKLPLKDIQFLTELHAYCLTRGDERYDYSSCSDCALSQFLKATGRAKHPSCSRAGWGENDTLDRHPLPRGLDGNVSVDEPSALLQGEWTFSALATRLEALLADAPAVEMVR